MRNTIECSNCQTNNDFTNLICKNCKHYLRDKVVNLDIWKIFWELLEQPTNAIKKIILSEHKNYLIILTLIIAIKVGLLGNLVVNILNINSGNTTNIFSNIFKFSTSFIIVYLTLSFITTKIISNKYSKISFKDSMAFIMFSFWSLTFSLVVLSIIEYALFGSYFFTFEFSPLEMKKYPFYILCFLEFIPIIASYIYLFIGLKLLSKNTIFALIYALFLVVVFILFLVLINMF